MRLNLRNLLGYIDDTLEPAQAKAIGQKIAENPQAQELMERIKQVVRKRRLSHGANGGGTLDPNTIAEYLDNTLSPEQSNEIEQICIDLDVQLAEVAACHQILTLVLGEPALVPPMSVQRMYGLVTGPEAIPTKKPPRTSSAGELDLASSMNDLDDTLRLGMPLLGGTKSWLILSCSGLLAIGLLILALFKVIDPPTNNQTPIGPLAQDDGKKKPEFVAPIPLPEPKETPAKPEPKDPKIEDKKPPEKVEVNLPPPKIDEPKDVDPAGFPKPPPPMLDNPVVPSVPLTPPDNTLAPVGSYRQPGVKETSILLAAPINKKSDWNRVGLNTPSVSSGQTFVALPGCRGDLDLKKGVKLTLWGSLPELIPALPLLESVVQLHQSSAFDVDLTLDRGRILLTNTKEKPATVRVRFENPTPGGKEDHADLVLSDPGTELVIDRWGTFPPGEHFFKDAKDPKRVGPIANVGFVVRKGSVQIRVGELTYSLFAPPGSALIFWNSAKGLGTPTPLAQLPDLVLDVAPAPQGFDKKLRDEKLRARDDLVIYFTNKAPDVGLAEALRSSEAPRRELAVLNYGALDFIGELVDALGEDRHREMRLAGITSLRNWISASRDNEYLALEELKKRYKILEAERILEFLHGSRDTELLIASLNSSALIVRELAHWNLLLAFPQGRAIVYDATADSSRRQIAQSAWQELVKRTPTGLPLPAPGK